MKIESFRDAAMTQHWLDEATHTARGALYDESGVLVGSSQRSMDSTDPWRNGDESVLTSPPAGERVPEAIFGGHVFSSWGHVITETISTAWAAAHLPNVPVVFLPWGRFWPAPAERAREVLTKAGWGDRELIFAEGALRFGTVHVPERAVNIADLRDRAGSVPNEMNRVYERLRAAAGPPEKRQEVFFERPVGHRRRHPAETDLAHRHVWRNVAVLRGWELTVNDQIRLAAGAKSITGFSGSNLHNSVFADEYTPVVELVDEREAERQRAGAVSLQEPLCRLRKQHLSHVSTYEDGKSASSWPAVLDRMAAQLQ